MSELPTPEYLNECFSYDPETGVLAWRERPREHFKNTQAWKAWNTKYAGTEAGHVDWHQAKRGRSPYRQVGMNGRLHKAHRLIFCLVEKRWPDDQIDHINGDGLDNRWRNLREASAGQNARNAARRKDNASGVCGVVWHKHRRKWRAQIRFRGRHIHLGIFDDFDDAVAARKAAERKYGFHPNHGAPVEYVDVEVSP